MNMLKLWMRSATRAEQDLLAERVGTSRGNLVQYAGGHRQASAKRGIAVEHETKTMHRASRGRLPRVYRTDLVEACRGCEYAQKCLGAAAVRADFPIVTAESAAAAAAVPEGRHAE